MNAHSPWKVRTDLSTEHGALAGTLDLVQEMLDRTDTQAHGIMSAYFAAARGGEDPGLNPHVQAVRSWAEQRKKDGAHVVRYFHCVAEQQIAVPDTLPDMAGLPEAPTSPAPSGAALQSVGGIILAAANK